MSGEERIDTNLPQTIDDHDNIEIDMHRKGASVFLSKKVDRALREGISTIKIRLKEGSSDCYPNICVPLAGVIDHYRTNFGIRFVPAKSWRNVKMIARSGTIVPYELDKLSPPGSFLNKVWKFSLGTHHDIVSGIIESLRRSGVMGKDVLHGFELALNEVTDNTLQHSIPKNETREPFGYVMVQHHRSRGRIVATVFDLGQGIAASLKEGGVPIRNTEEALVQAMKRGVTSGDGAGNGLWMMERIILESSGSFDVVSDGSKHALRNSDSAYPRVTSSFQAYR